MIISASKCCVRIVHFHSHWSFTICCSWRSRVPTFKLHFDVPKGSTLGHLLFSLYTTRLQEISYTLYIYHYTWNLHCMWYADETQIYIMIDPAEKLSALARLHHLCIEVVLTWILNNLLKWNQGKTDTAIFSSLPPWNQEFSLCIYLHSVSESLIIT